MVKSSRFYAVFIDLPIQRPFGSTEDDCREQLAECFAWCKEHVGQMGDNWAPAYRAFGVSFVFQHEADSILFTLRFSDMRVNNN
jgi:hypothetical protein